LLEIFKKYHPALAFVLRFFVVYILLTFVYNYYLGSFESKPDAVTIAVAQQCKSIMESINYESATNIFEGESYVRFLVKGKPTAVIVEGCNSISVIILFLSFIIAFKGSLLNTLWFVLAGSIVIYLANLARIVLLLIGYYEIPQYKDFLHTIIFPLIIYGIVFIMWMIWVNKLARR
jgi:exosortase family protein XrtF